MKLKTCLRRTHSGSREWARSRRRPGSAVKRNREPALGDTSPGDHGLLTGAAALQPDPPRPKSSRAAGGTLGILVVRARHGMRWMLREPGQAYRRPLAQGLRAAASAAAAQQALGAAPPGTRARPSAGRPASAPAPRCDHPRTAATRVPALARPDAPRLALAARALWCGAQAPLQSRHERAFLSLHVFINHLVFNTFITLFHPTPFILPSCGRECVTSHTRYFLGGL